jgi:hypothetical protein
MSVDPYQEKLESSARLIRYKRSRRYTSLNAVGTHLADLLADEPAFRWPQGDAGVKASEVKKSFTWRLAMLLYSDEARRPFQLDMEPKVKPGRQVSDDRSRSPSRYSGDHRHYGRSPPRPYDRSQCEYEHPPGRQYDHPPARLKRLPAQQYDQSPACHDQSPQRSRGHVRSPSRDYSRTSRSSLRRFEHSPLQHPDTEADAELKLRAMMARIRTIRQQNQLLVL